MSSNFFGKTSQKKMIFDDAGLMKIQLISVNRPFFYFHIVFLKLFWEVM